MTEKELAMHELEMKVMPAIKVLPGDTIHLKGQSIAIKRVEPLTETLIRIHGNVMSFECSLVVDARLALTVFRTVTN